MKVYISGPISDMPSIEISKNIFMAAEEIIKGYGYTPVNPHKICSSLPVGSEWKEYMKICIASLFDCDMIYMLPNWQKSKGATIEYSLAVQFGLKILG